MNFSFRRRDGILWGVYHGPRPFASDFDSRARIALLACVLGVASLAAGQTTAPADETPSTDEQLVRAMQAQASPLGPPKVSALWYPPRNLPEGAKAPVAVVLASKTLPADKKGFWIPALWRLNFCTLVLRCNDDRWGHVRVAEVIRNLRRVPASIPADVSRVLLISDQPGETIPKRMVPAYPKTLVGAVLIDVNPIELTPRGYQLWTPTDRGWAVPMWIVIGSASDDQASQLRLWRKFQALAPESASVTLDIRQGRKGGSLLPDAAISRWLGAIARGQKPAAGPDTQVEQEKQSYAPLARTLREQMSIAAGAAEPGETITKKDGPFRLSVTAPQGWQRQPEREKPYNPTGQDAQMGLSKQARSPYAAIYLTPNAQEKFFAKVRAAEWANPPAELLDDHAKKLQENGYLHVPLLRWTQGQWALQASTIQLYWQGGWHRWVVLSAARAGSKAAPGGSLVMVMDSSGQPDPAAMAAAMKRIIQSTQVDWLGHDAYAPRPLGK
jgi:hypothetical protein